MREEPKTVPCQWCETQTIYTHTQCCDDCWELSTRMRRRPFEVIEAMFRAKKSGTL